MEHKENIEKKVIKIKGNGDTAEKKMNVIMFGLKEKFLPLKLKR